MITIPLYTLLVIYAIFLFIFFTFFIINFFHILLTGTTTLGSFIVTFAIIALAVLTLFGTWYYLKNIDFREPLLTLNLSFISNLLHPNLGNNSPLF